jgi:hypothetical protein
VIKLSRSVRVSRKALETFIDAGGKRGPDDHNRVAS